MSVQLNADVYHMLKNADRITLKIPSTVSPLSAFEVDGATYPDLERHSNNKFSLWFMSMVARPGFKTNKGGDEIISDSS